MRSQRPSLGSFLPPPPTILFSHTLLQRLYCSLGKSVPFCPEHCPEHPLPTHLSGAGNFTKRDFALLGQGGAQSQVLHLYLRWADLNIFVQVD